VDNLVEHNAALLAKEPRRQCSATFSGESHRKAGRLRLEEIWAEWDRDCHHWSEVVGREQSR